MNAMRRTRAKAPEPITLQRAPLLAGLTGDQLEKVSGEVRLRSFRRRETVINKGSAGDSLLFLLEGHLQVVDVTEDGRSVGLNLLSPGDFFGEIAVVDGGTRSASVTALTHAKVAFLPRATALWVFSHCPPVAERMLQHMAAKIRKESVFRTLLGIHNAFQRVYALLDLFRQTKPGGLEVIDNLPAQQDMAIMINTSRETVSRAISSLIEDGVIEKDARRLIIRRPEVLRRLALHGAGSGRAGPESGH